ncbi:hypothetical protein HJC23_003543 [Cyclotella cryptica]|uniref:Uncharacterized protein n=1 Tax=Cyclotella cryptica TaxID=29204 RepID=A0ABD3P087_9STRA|eukprot:CCRYP_018591-RA/>CCRYP_018591-RA protein AED:0.04 eAED:0.04 QI:460/-1/1/1/-1/1/1/253/1261
MPAVFFNDYPPGNAANPSAAQMAQSPGNSYGYWPHYDQQYQQQRPTSPAFSSAATSQASAYHNSFTGYLPTSSFSPTASSVPSHMPPLSPQQQLMASYPSANSSMASPASLNTAALFAQHQRYYGQQYYPQPPAAATSPRHFHFAASHEYDLRSDVGSAVGSGSLHNPGDGVSSPRSPRSSVPSHRSDAGSNALDASLENQVSYESSRNGLCQDERDGLASLLSCSLISPRGGDERNDVLNEDDEDLFLFSDDEKDEKDDQVQKEGAAAEEEVKRSSPTIVQLANSFGCLSGELQDEEEEDSLYTTDEESKRGGERAKSVVSPVSLADQDAASDDDDRTMDDTLDHDVEDGKKIERASSTHSKNKKMVTIRSYHEQDGNATIEANPTFQSKQSSIGSSKKKSLLEQAKQRPVHSDIKPYKPEVHIPDDESEASLIVLMRYMGCTPQAFGQRKQNTSANGNVDLPSGKEFLFDTDDEDDDLTTLSGGTYASSIKDINTCTWTVDGEGEEGIELLINDYLPPSMRLKRSVSLDEGTTMSGMFGSESISKTASTIEENESLGDPVTAAVKAVNNSIISGALSPRAAQMNKATASKSVSQKMRSKPALTVKTRINDDSSGALKSNIVKEEEQMTKTASNVSRTVQQLVQPRQSVISPTNTASSNTGTKAMSPASEARAFLASQNDSAPSAKSSIEKVALSASPSSTGASGRKNKQVEQKVYPATSPSTEAKAICTLKDAITNVTRAPQTPHVSTDHEGVHLALEAAKANASHSTPMDPSDESPVVDTKNEQTEQPESASSVSSKRISDKSTSEVGNIVTANLSKPKDLPGDKETRVSSISVGKASSPSVHEIAKSNLVARSTPAVTKVSADLAVSNRMKVDPPTREGFSQKKLEPSGALFGKNESNKSGMTALEMKLANKAVLKPLKTDGSLTNMQIDGKNSALTPVSNISESTMGTLDTMALILMAQRVSSDVKQRTDAAKKAPSYDLLKKYGSSNRALWEDSSSSYPRATISTIKEMPSATAAEEESSDADKRERFWTNKPNETAEKINTCQDQQNKYRPDIAAANSNNLTHNGKIRRTDSAASGPSFSPEESSSFDKNDVVKGTKKESIISTASPHETTHDKMKELKLSTLSPEENAREPPPPLTPCRESVREVDELLSKTRSWLARHNEDRKARTELSSIKEPSFLQSRQASVHFTGRSRLEVNTGNPVSPTVGTSASPANLASPNSDVSSVSRKSILEELADLKAKQMKNSRRNAKARLE